MKTQTNSTKPSLLLSVLIAACLAFAGCSLENGEGEAINGRDGSSIWSFKDGVLTIRGGMQNYTFDNHAPWQPYYRSIKEVVIAEGVAFIGSHAFEDCIYIEKVSIPVSVQQVGRCAFLNCHALTSFEIATGNTVFTSKDGILFAFDEEKTVLVAYPSARGSYTIPDGVDGIADWAFACCPYLTGITIPGTVESIGDSAFWTCDALESITIGEGVKTIGENAFDARSPHITSLVIPDSVESIGFGVMAAGPNMVSLSIPGINFANSIGGLPITELTITSGIVIGYETTSCFHECTELKNVILTDGVTEVSYLAFAHCRKLETISIGSGVTNIETSSCFDFCEQLRRIDVATENPNYRSIDGVLFNKTTTTLLLYPIGSSRNSYTVPGGVTTLPDGVFNGFTGQVLILPASMSYIGFNVFGNWRNMINVYVSARTPPEMMMQHYFNVFSITPTLYVPYGYRTTYEEAYPWNEYFKTVREQF